MVPAHVHFYAGAFVRTHQGANPTCGYVAMPRAATPAAVSLTLRRTQCSAPPPLCHVSRVAPSPAPRHTTVRASLPRPLRTHLGPQSVSPRGTPSPTPRCRCRVVFVVTVCVACAAPLCYACRAAAPDRATRAMLGRLWGAPVTVLATRRLLALLVNVILAIAYSASIAAASYRGDVAVILSTAIGRALPPFVMLLLVARVTDDRVWQPLWGATYVHDALVACTFKLLSMRGVRRRVGSVCGRSGCALVFVIDRGGSVPLLLCAVTASS